MRVKVQLFARLREIVGANEVVSEVPDSGTIGDLWSILCAAHPGLEAYAGSVSCARNADYVRMTARVEDGDEVAFLPPVSGG